MLYLVVMTKMFKNEPDLIFLNLKCIYSLKIKIHT